MQQKAFIKFLKSGLILLLILFVLDRTIGWGLEQLFYKQKHGDDVVSIHMLEHAREDILVFGGSRASHHYISSSIEDSTHFSCFNGGRDNMTIAYTAAVLPIIYERYSPKIIVLEMHPVELTPKPSEKKITYERVSAALLPFFHRHPQLASTIDMANEHELLKAKISHIYPYNSTIGSSIQNTYTNLGHTTIKGYEPLYATIDSTNYKAPMWGNFAENHPLDTNMINAYRTVLSLAKQHHSRLIGIISPFYFPIDLEHNDGYKTVKAMLQQYGFEFYDFSHDRRFMLHPNLFKDDVHLNDSGAHIYTQSIISIIQSR